MHDWLSNRIAEMPEWEAEFALTLSPDEFYARYRSSE